MDSDDDLLAEQAAYYRAAADEYADDVAAGRELAAALDRFAPARDVLELAGGLGRVSQSRSQSRIEARTTAPWKTVACLS